MMERAELLGFLPEIVESTKKALMDEGALPPAALVVFSDKFADEPHLQDLAERLVQDVDEIGQVIASPDVSCLAIQIDSADNVAAVEEEILNDLVRAEGAYACYRVAAAFLPATSERALFFSFEDGEGHLGWMVKMHEKDGALELGELESMGPVLSEKTFFAAPTAH